MKQTLLHILAGAALLFAATTANAQGIKVIKTDGTTIDIPAAELSRIETYDAAAAAPFYEGTWKMRKLVTDREAMDATWIPYATFDDSFPAFDAADELTFENGVLKANLQSTLKNYFKPEATYEPAGTFSFHADFTTMIEVTLLKVKGINRNFDAESVSEDDEALLGLRLVEDEDADEAGVYYLDVYILDYESTSFAPEFAENFMYDEEKPVATMAGVFINFTMDKAE